MAGGKIKREKPHRGGTPASANPHYQGGIPFHKSKGQHILKNPLLIDTIIEKSGIKSTDIILEIGPGTGNLTKKLLEAGKSVIAVELDPRMVLELQRHFQGTAFSNRLKEVDVVTSCEESSPLGLRLTKTPSFLNLVEMKLSQARSKSCSNDQKPQDSVHDTRMDDFVPQPMSDREKLKASNFPALLLKIGSWERLTRKEGDLLAKCYYAKRKIVWEVLEGTLKSKIEIQWADIEAIRAIIRDDEPGILEIELKQSPLFFREINPQPRKHTIWNEAPDFTGGQARIYRRHLVKFPPGTLDKHYEKLLQSDDHLLELSQRPFPSLNSPYFSSNNIYGVSNIPFDFPSCNSPFPLPAIPPSLVPAHQLQNFKLSPGQTFGTMSSSDSPMSVTNCAWREDNIIDSTFDNPWMDPNTGLLIDLENHFLSESQNEWSDERKLIARLRSMCQPFQEVNPENRIGMHQLEYNHEAFYDDQSIVGGDKAFEVDGGLTNPQPIGWLSPQIFYENQMMNFLSENSLYQYDLSQQKVMDYAATGIGHEVDRWR